MEKKIKSVNLETSTSKSLTNLNHKQPVSDNNLLFSFEDGQTGKPSQSFSNHAAKCLNKTFIYFLIFQLFLF